MDKSSKIIVKIANVFLALALFLQANEFVVRHSLNALHCSIFGYFVFGFIINLTKFFQLKTKPLNERNSLGFLMFLILFDCLYFAAVFLGFGTSYFFK